MTLIAVGRIEICLILSHAVILTLESKFIKLCKYLKPVVFPYDPGKHGSGILTPPMQKYPLGQIVG